jgi:CubicO group peptidase (beta-lactamase class C family)
MIDSGFFVPPEKVHRLSAVYRHAGDDAFELDEAPADSKRIVPNPITAGGGRLVSTAPDYARFAQMMLNGGILDNTRILSRKSVALMTTNHLTPEVMPSFNVVRLGKGYYTKGYGYGFGVRVFMDPVLNEIVGSVGSYGWSGALNTYFWVDPQEQLIGLVWAQMPDLYRYPIERQFMTLAYQAIDD